ncbi:MAG: hypothetical protein ACJ76Z_03615 [Thermoleophilaceae bacterium]
MTWKPEYTIALIPIVGAIVVNIVVTLASKSTAAGQWSAIIFFFVSVPFVVGRLIDRAR